jgi:hypothetical protein
MKIEVIRQEFTDVSTIGSLLINGEFFCYTLEDKVREVPGEPVEKWKKPEITAIPRGTYRLVINMSPRFKKPLPLLLGVPGFTGVRIHSGNVAEHTEGCILVGNTKSKNFVGESRKAFDALFAKIRVEKDDITITVR